MPLRIYEDTYLTVDELFQYLEGLGYSGALNDMMYQKLVADGYTGALGDMIALDPAPGGGGGGPSVGDGLILEAGTDFLILETGDYLLLE